MLFKCTADVRARMADMAHHYANLIAEQNPEMPPSERSSKAIEMMRAAFATPPRFFFPVEVPFPQHCWSCDTLSVESLKRAVTTGSPETLHAVLSAGLLAASDVRPVVFAFLDHVGVEEMRGIRFLSEVDASFRAANRQSDTSALGPVFVQCAERLVSWSAAESIVVFRTHSVTRASLVGRALLWLCSALVLCDEESRRQLLKHLGALVSQQQGSVEEAVVLLSGASPEVFGAILDDLQMLLTIELVTRASVEHLLYLVQLVGLWYKANFRLATVSGIVPYTKFYNGTADEFDDQDIAKDFVRSIRGEFSFCAYPFLINARFKSVVLQLEASVEREGALEQAIITNLFSGRGNEVLDDFFLVLRIDRRDIVGSAVKELFRKTSKLRRPLRVQFVGEEGVDEGGLKKEFFQLLCRELLHPDYNMFMDRGGDRTLWFVPAVQNPGNLREYHLIGQVIGLAVYNNIIVDLPFPMAVFRKLLGVPVTLQDLAEVDPALFSGLEQLLAFEETEGVTVESTFCRTFTFEHEVFGQHVEVPLMEGGQSIALTAQNRAEFVKCMAEYILTKSVTQSFEAFRDGFYSVCKRGLILSLRPEELEQLVCGNRVLDFHELQDNTYYDGYEKDDDIVVQFWEVVHELSLDEKKKFLRFCTGSDKVPVGGLKDLKFVLGRIGADDNMLPTAHTCFNHLLLPPYSSKSRLKEKLLLAIENCEGFYGGR